MRLTKKVGDFLGGESSKIDLFSCHLRGSADFENMRNFVESRNGFSAASFKLEQMKKKFVTCVICVSRSSAFPPFLYPRSDYLSKSYLNLHSSPRHSLKRPSSSNMRTVMSTLQSACCFGNTAIQRLRSPHQNTALHALFVLTV